MKHWFGTCVVCVISNLGDFTLKLTCTTSVSLHLIMPRTPNWLCTFGFFFLQLYLSVICGKKTSMTTGVPSLKYPLLAHDAVDLTWSDSYVCGRKFNDLYWSPSANKLNDRFYQEKWKTVDKLLREVKCSWLVIVNNSTWTSPGSIPINFR